MTFLEALYRGLSTPKLLELRQALQLDRPNADAEGRAFIDGRLALIAAELRARREPDPHDVSGTP